MLCGSSTQCDGLKNIFKSLHTIQTFQWCLYFFWITIKMMEIQLVKNISWDIDIPSGIFYSLSNIIYFVILTICQVPQISSALYTGQGKGRFEMLLPGEMFRRRRVGRKWTHSTSNVISFSWGNSAGEDLAKKNPQSLYCYSWFSQQLLIANCISHQLWLQSLSPSVLLST